MSKIIIIDDDESSRLSLTSYLEELGYTAYPAEDGESGLDSVKKINPDVVISDIKMPGISGLEVLSAVKEYNSLIQVIIITAFDTMDSTIQATRMGAYDYIEKPVDINRLRISITRALENKKLSERLDAMESTGEEESGEFTLVGKSPLMKDVYKKIGQASANKVNVLIQGESGTGKELIAKIIHYSGTWKKEPFIAINCTALPENLLESELFGHEKGAFTDAVRDKRGKFELAGEGTIFLDEISEMSLNLQAKLLRVLQENEFERVGGEATIPMKARVIAATNSKLENLVAEGKFREDLYYRLNVFTVFPSPLRDKKEDIEILVKHFLKKINLRLHKNIVKVEDGVIAMLKNQNWFGNVRELENTLMQAVVLSTGDVLEKENILIRSAGIISGDGGDVLGDLSLAEVEKNYIKKILDKTSWNIQSTCRILGISKPTLYRKISIYNLR